MRKEASVHTMTFYAQDQAGDAAGEHGSDAFDFAM